MKSIILHEGKLLWIFTALALLLIISFGFFSYKVEIDNKSLSYKINLTKSSRNYVKLENIDKKFLDSIVAIEDHRFYSHGALDYISIVRATINNVKARRVVEGGSTITQQLAKNLCLSNERSFKRKFKETLLAFQLEKKYSKEEILELYVNVINFGDGNIGIGQAAKGYFGKNAKYLTYGEATMLAGLPQAPSVYALSNNNELSKKRQSQVINALEKYNGIKEENFAVTPKFECNK